MKLFASLLMLFALMSPAHAAGDCSEVELPAGTVLKDGTIAGESEALTYFKDREPGLAHQLLQQDAKAMREAYGKYFVWFQRVGPCRKNQKVVAIKGIKSDMRLKAIAQSYSANNSVWPSPTVKTEARQLIADRVDSETSMMTAQLDSMQKSVEDLQNQITALAQKIQERHQSREILIDAQLETTLK